MPKDNYKRINILIREDQYDLITKHKLSLSGLVRDLIDDRFSKNVILLHVSSKLKKLYDKLISNFGATDRELEKYLVKALDQCLQDKSAEIAKIRKELKSR